VTSLTAFSVPRTASWTPRVSAPPADRPLLAALSLPAAFPLLAALLLPAALEPAALLPPVVPLPAPDDTDESGWLPAAPPTSPLALPAPFPPVTALEPDPAPLVLPVALFPSLEPQAAREKTAIIAASKSAYVLFKSFSSFFWSVPDSAVLLARRSPVRDTRRIVSHAAVEKNRQFFEVRRLVFFGGLGILLLSSKASNQKIHQGGEPTWN